MCICFLLIIPAVVVFLNVFLCEITASSFFAFGSFTVFVYCFMLLLFSVLPDFAKICNTF